MCSSLESLYLPGELSYHFVVHPLSLTFLFAFKPVFSDMNRGTQAFCCWLAYLPCIPLFIFFAFTLSKPYVLVHLL